MVMTMKVEKLSASRINTYTKCSMRFFFRYVMGEKSIPTGAMVLGSAFHDSANFNYEQKIDSRQDLPEKDVLEFFSASYDFGCREVIWESDEDKGVVKDSGISLMSHYHGLVSPMTQPLAVEKFFEFEEEAVDLYEEEEYSFPITGFIDCVQEDVTVIETKTTRSRPTTPSSDHFLQACLYCKAIRNNGIEEKETRFDYAIKTKTPQIVQLYRKMTDDDIAYLDNMIYRVRRGIELEHWIPNRNQRIGCSRRWCSYWEMCEQECGGRVPE